MGAGLVIGPFSLTTDPALVEIMGWAGFDDVVLDMEHGPGSLQVEGVDVLFVGPYDLSQSLGVVGQVDHPLVVETITRIVGRCVEKGVCAGLFTAACRAAVKE